MTFPRVSQGLQGQNALITKWLDDQDWEYYSVYVPPKRHFVPYAEQDLVFTLQCTQSSLRVWSTRLRSGLVLALAARKARRSNNACQIKPDYERHVNVTTLHKQCTTTIHRGYQSAQDNWSSPWQLLQIIHHRWQIKLLLLVQSISKLTPDKYSNVCMVRQRFREVVFKLTHVKPGLVLLRELLYIGRTWWLIWSLRVHISTGSFLKGKAADCGSYCANTSCHWWFYKLGQPATSVVCDPHKDQTEMWQNKSHANKWVNN